MKQSPDDSNIRQTLQQLKRTEQQQTPSFDDVLGREQVSPAPTLFSRGQLVAFGCAAAILLAVIVVRRIQDHDVPKNQVVQGDLSALSDELAVSACLADLDFGYLNHLVDAHFERHETETTDPMNVWSSGTETLLALNLGVNFNEQSAKNTQ